MIMISNQEAPLLQLLIGVIVRGAERHSPTPLFFGFLSTRPSACPGLLPLDCFLPSPEHILQFFMPCVYRTITVSALLTSRKWSRPIAPLFFYNGSNTSRRPLECVFGIVRGFVFSSLNARSWSSCSSMKHKAIN